MKDVVFEIFFFIKFIMFTCDLSDQINVLFYFFILDSF